MAKNEKMIIEYDNATKKWFDAHPCSETTVAKCESCGLFYKPILGHKCKKQKKGERQNVFI